MKIKTTLRYPLIPVRMDTFKNTEDILERKVGENVESGEHSSTAGGSANLYSHFQNQYGSFSENWEPIYLKTQ